jgi:hypothetical protein
MKPPRLSDEEQAAFKAELQPLRRDAAKLRDERQKFITPDRDPGRAVLDRWKAEVTAQRAGLSRLHAMLVQDRAIRAPVHHYDRWHRVDTITTINEFEVQYFRHLFLGEPHPGASDDQRAFSSKA